MQFNRHQLPRAQNRVEKGGQLAWRGKEDTSTSRIQMMRNWKFDRDLDHLGREYRWKEEGIRASC